MSDLLSWGRRILVGVLLLGFGALLMAAVIVPRVGGASTYTVLTGSMRPDLPPGTLVVVRPVEDDAIGVGSVITYQLESGRPEVATHRVVAQGYNGAGELRWRTQGDANGAPDAAQVRPAQVKGELWYSVPWVGHLSTWLTPDQRRFAVQAVAAVLLGYAAFQWSRAWRSRRREEARA